MSTDIRPELSSKNKYYIGKHRYYELKHFCMQYHEWKKQIFAINSYPSLDGEYVMAGDVAKPVEVCVALRERYSQNIDLVERIAKETDPGLWEYILVGVTEGVAYDFLLSRLEIPCCKDIYYDRYRRFFWLLDIARK